MSDIATLTPENATFADSGSSTLLLTVVGKDEPCRVSVRPMFPLSHPGKFLSVQNEESEEVGVIEDLADCLFQRLFFRYPNRF